MTAEDKVELQIIIEEAVLRAWAKIKCEMEAKPAGKISEPVSQEWVA